MSEINFEDTIINITLGDIVQQFTEEDLQRQMPILMQDIDAETKELVDTYQSYISAGNFAEAATYRANNPALETRIWDAFKANSTAVFSLYTYLYAKSKGQQCIVSATQPPEASEDGSVIGQIEGDIWFRIDEEKDGVINTTPFQKQADGTYKEFTVAPKLSFASNEDIDEIYNENIEELTNKNSLVNNEALKYYSSLLNAELSSLARGIEDCFQSASDGKELIANTITGYGIDTKKDDTYEAINNNIDSLIINYKTQIANSLKQLGVSASASESIESLCNKIKNNLLKWSTAVSLSGSFTKNYGYRYHYESVTFSRAFSVNPKITVSSSDGMYSVSAKDITQTGFVIQIYNGQTDTPTTTVTWRAQAPKFL